MAHPTRRVIRLGWIILGILTAGILLSSVIFPAWLSLFLLLPTILVWGVLLVAYHCRLAHWRSVWLAWLAFGLLRGALTWMEPAGIPGILLTSLLAILCLYAWLAGYAALIALVCHRDVSVAYIFLPSAIGALAVLLTVRAAGSVTQWFDALTLAAPTVGRTLLFEPLLLSLSCMGTLGFIALVPHMIVTVARELQGNPPANRAR